MPKVITTRPSVFARNLQRLRKARQLTQEELAEQLGVAKSTVGYYESSAKNPRLATLKKIAEFFEVSTAELVSDGDASASTGRTSRLDRQVERIKQLSPAKQRMIGDMLEAALNAR